tara:strand:+ start:2754 stop:4154 length:1401 start_codon:yes stop_codon:yes gene_type:complete
MDVKFIKNGQDQDPGQSWDATSGDFPKPPFNGFVASPYIKGVFDLRWDHPSLLSANTSWDIIGVNIYRSLASDRGPFFRINEYPIGATFYRDATTNELIQHETVQWCDWISTGNQAGRQRWSFKTKKAIYKQTGNAIFANNPKDVQVFINGQRVAVHEVFGRTGEIILVNVSAADVGTQQWESMPTLNEHTPVTVTYYTNTNKTVTTGLDRKVFYRLTTVAKIDGGLIETPLNQTEPITPIAVESMDWIWKEAVLRNQWILEQGGERVKLFVRKHSGIPCHCAMDARTREFGQQPSQRCELCFGVGFLGGYEGPYEIIICPDDGTRTVSQTPQGRRLEHSYDCWMGPSPMVTQRDFIVKQTNERFSIGPVQRPTNRGNILQQHFPVGYLDEGDIRYNVPVDGTDTLAFPEVRTTRSAFPSADGRHPHDPPHPTGPETKTPMTTEHDAIDDNREHRGRTPVWKNQNY